MLKLIAMASIPCPSETIFFPKFLGFGIKAFPLSPLVPKTSKKYELCQTLAANLCETGAAVVAADDVDDDVCTEVVINPDDYHQRRN